MGCKTLLSLTYATSNEFSKMYPFRARFLCFVLEICNDVTPPDTYSVQTPFGGVTDCVGTSTARVILFGTIPTTIPSTTPTIDLPVIHDDTLLTPTISPVVPTIPPVASIIQYTSPFIDTDSSDSDTPDSPPSLPGRVLYHYLPIDLHQDTHQISLHQILLRDILPLGYAISDSLDGSSVFASARPSRKRCRSSSALVSSPMRRALSLIHANLSLLPKRIRDSDSVMDLEVSSKECYGSYLPREVGLGVDVEDSYEPYTEPDINFDIQADIDECITYADAIRAKGMDDRDVVETVAEEEIESRERDMVEVEVDPRVGPVIKDDVRESVREEVLDQV
ncbi:hypothetical protein Tco_0813428, partial [Tanacetum coccineum]